MWLCSFAKSDTHTESNGWEQERSITQDNELREESIDGLLEMLRTCFLEFIPELEDPELLEKIGSTEKRGGKGAHNYNQ